MAVCNGLTFLDVKNESLSAMMEDDFVFVDSPWILRTFRCYHCNDIAIEHNIAECKDILCRKCFNEFFQKRCPVCQTCEIKTIRQDPTFEQGLLNLNVECIYKKNGCVEILSLKNYRDHKNKCSFSTEALLPKVYNGLSSNKALEQLSEDVLQVLTTLQKVEKDLTGAFLNNNEKCKDFRAVQQDVQSIKSILIAEQKERREFESKLMANLTNMDHSQQLLVGLFTKVTNEILQLKQQITGQHQTNNSLDEGDVQSTIYVWKVEGIMQKLEDRQYLQLQTVDSSVFVTKEFGFKLKATIEIKSDSDYLSIRVNFINDDASNWYKDPSNYLHSRRYFLLDQSDRQEKCHITILDQPRLSSGHGHRLLQGWLTHTYDHFAPIKLLLKDDTYIRNDSMLIKILVRPITLMYKTVASYDGILLLRVKNYAERKQDEVDGVIECLHGKTFYTKQKGYRVQPKLYLNGYDKWRGKYISVSVCFYIGEWDVMLKTSFKFSVTFTLLDQSDTSKKKHIVKHLDIREYKENYTYNGVTDFVLQSQAEGPRYLKNDTMLVKIEVQVYE